MRLNNLAGISLILLDSLSVASLYAIIKFVTQEIPSNYLVFLYKSFLFILTLPWIFHKGGIDNIKTPYLKIHLLRAFFSVGGSLAFMYGLQYVRLLDATVLQNIEQVLLVAVGMLFFHEKITKLKLISIFLSLIGVLIVVKPGLLFMEDIEFSSIQINHGYFFIFLSIGFWVCNNIVIKKLGQKSTNKAQLFYLMFFSVLFTYPVAFFEWGKLDIMNVTFFTPIRRVSFSEIGLEINHILMILGMSLCYLVHSISLFNALKFGEFSVVMPFVYFKLLWAGLFGYVLFSTIPHNMSWVGYSLIVSAGLLLMHREIKNRKRQYLEESC